MKLYFVDAQGETLTVSVRDRTHAFEVFQQSILSDPWVGASLRDVNNKFVDSFIRITEPAEIHAMIDQKIIAESLAVRSVCRSGYPDLNVPKWFIPGLCHEVSEHIQEEFGFARTSGTIMAKDLVTPICRHYWNVLPDLSILDMTADQLMEGSDYRIIPKGHADWYRYQPEYRYQEDVADLRGEGIYSDELIDFILETAARIEKADALPVKAIDRLATPVAGLQAKLEPFILEFLELALKDNHKEPNNKTSFESSEFSPTR